MRPRGLATATGLDAEMIQTRRCDAVHFPEPSERVNRPVRPRRLIARISTAAVVGFDPRMTRLVCYYSASQCLPPKLHTGESYLFRGHRTVAIHKDETSKRPDQDPRDHSEDGADKWHHRAPDGRAHQRRRPLADRIFGCLNPLVCQRFRKTRQLIVDLFLIGVARVEDQVIEDYKIAQIHIYRRERQAHVVRAIVDVHGWVRVTVFHLEMGS